MVMLDGKGSLLFIRLITPRLADDQALSAKINKPSNPVVSAVRSLGDGAVELVGIEELREEMKKREEQYWASKSVQKGR